MDSYEKLVTYCSPSALRVFERDETESSTGGIRTRDSFLAEYLVVVIDERRVERWEKGSDCTELLPCSCWGSRWWKQLSSETLDSLVVWWHCA